MTPPLPARRYFGVILLAGLLGLSILLAAPGGAQHLFEAPWMSYNAGYFVEAPMGGGNDGRWPVAITTADLNGDGRPDLVLARGTWNSGVVVFLSEGDDYSLPVFYPATYGSSTDVVAADFDGDGHIDLATSDGSDYGNGGRRVSVYRNRGDGTFDPAVRFDTQAAPMALVAADIDGDGHPDLATADFDWPGGAGYVSVLIADGAGGFAPRRTFPIPVAANDIAAGDLNGNGHLDLVVAHNSDGLSVLFNDGSGHFGAPMLMSGLGIGGTTAFAAVALADLNGDGDLDIIAGHNRTSQGSYDAVVLFDNNGDGTFAAPRYARLGQYRGGPSALATGDVNGDGFPDLLSASPNLRDIRFILNDGAGGFLPAETVIAGQWPRGLALADANGDGHLDLITADGISMAATVHLNDGTGRYAGAPVVRAVEGWGITDIGDVDGDGHVDVLTVVGANAYTYLGDGAGAFASGPVYINTRAMLSARLRDLDGDGVLDLLFAANQPGSSSIYDFYTAKGNGDGSFGQASRWIAGAGSPPTVYAFDFDGDGHRDVLIMVSANDLQTSKVRIYSNDGAGFFSFASEFDVQAGPSNAVAGDFNQDGHLDFATAHKGAYGAFNYVNVHIGNGDFTFQPWVSYTVGFGPAHIEAADLNDDGLLDLVTGNIGVDNTGDETVSVLMGQPGGTFASAVTYYAPYDYEGPGLSGLAVGDADGDGDLDLMTSSNGSNDVAFYENRGDGTFTFRSRYGLGERASSLYYADVTGDGVGDLLSITHGYAVYSPHLTVMRGARGTPTQQEPELDPRLTGTHRLSPAYPNPFNRATTFTLVLAHRQHVEVAVYDMLGRRVAVLFDEHIEAGVEHRFTFEASGLPSGLYVVRVTGETVSATRTATLLR